MLDSLDWTPATIQDSFRRFDLNQGLVGIHVADQDFEGLFRMRLKGHAEFMREFGAPPPDCLIALSPRPSSGLFVLCVLGCSETSLVISIEWPIPHVEHPFSYANALDQRLCGDGALSRRAGSVRETEGESVSGWSCCELLSLVMVISLFILRVMTPPPEHRP